MGVDEIKGKSEKKGKKKERKKSSCSLFDSLKNGIYATAEDICLFCRVLHSLQNVCLS